MHYLLFYEVGDDYVSRRAEFRDAHLRKAWEASDRGELVLAGPLADPVDGAVLLFEGDSPEVAAKFARADPYVTSGAVSRWHVREWTTVVGPGASRPVVPESATERGRMEHGRSAESGPTRDRGTVVRMWKARCAAGDADRYVRHATTRVFPALRAIDGHRGAYLLRRAIDGAVEFVVLTLWQSMNAVRRFAGDEPERAVVEPEAKAILTAFDESVTHFEIVEAPDEARDQRS
jgi:uncharacterized protein